MKHIVKNPEPPEFIEWKEEFRNTGIEPGWGEFDGKPIKQTVKAALIKEQGGLCCFCESLIPADTSRYGHIAHWEAKAKDKSPYKALEYDNLLYSCSDNQMKIPSTCGVAQKEETPPISPLDEDCETHFAYSESGNILGKNDHAQETIRMLNLNGSKRLRDSRRLVFEETRNNKRILLPHEFDRWLDNELKRQSDGTFKEYWTTIKYAAGLYE